MVTSSIGYGRTARLTISARIHDVLSGLGCIGKSELRHEQALILSMAVVVAPVRVSGPARVAMLYSVLYKPVTFR
ncbi:uncharacterized protein RSE6_09039 [Rhynchosporium secalis]|uniref:Uncharacterized protein n=1 Tax=Rhynchosporium secalis TaxID=38038 RepID=A0A1E1MH39_RHYSE|nr:uncharacterized protein RSE6_09039 [Rhynchosporium secalis]